ncbi:hypothetical protein SADUNF_Sadunf03G0108100 [Salix dunnii]|uniref:Uncharacterized protein n=1 Tax=Salix dunnii TaxID=1413687 RepID=A0A835K887_9ROSI|nr:hypothetical protein SADUNF_Sadunf03G0108100 [Salix dunnii]
MESSSPSSSLTSNSSPFSIHYPSSHYLKPSSLPVKLQNSSTKHTATRSTTAVKGQTAGFTGSCYEGGLGSVDEPDSPFKSVTMTAAEEFETPPCPPGFRQYESMAVLRPDMSENGRLALAQKHKIYLLFLFSS